MVARIIKGPRNLYLPPYYQAWRLRQGRKIYGAKCKDCGGRCKYTATRCKTCDGKNRRTIYAIYDYTRYQTPAKARALELLRGPVKRTDAAISLQVGLSRERIRQIRSAAGIATYSQANTLITWPCPACGVAVEMWTAQRNRRLTAWCNKCARKMAGVARRKPLQPVVCMDCGAKRIYKGRHNALRVMKHSPKRCNRCHGKWLQRSKSIQTHCKYGHEFTAENTYVHKGGRHCRICSTRRSRESHRRNYVPKPPRTHCKWGHLYTELNTYRNPSGARNCRECNRLRHRKGRKR